MTRSNTEVAAEHQHRPREGRLTVMLHLLCFIPISMIVWLCDMCIRNRSMWPQYHLRQHLCTAGFRSACRRMCVDVTIATVQTLRSQAVEWTWRSWPPVCLWNSLYLQWMTHRGIWCVVLLRCCSAVAITCTSPPLLLHPLLLPPLLLLPLLLPPSSLLLLLQVSECNWPSRQAPSLHNLFAVCKNMHNWLKQNPKNVCVITCSVREQSPRQVQPPVLNLIFPDYIKKVE